MNGSSEIRASDLGDMPVRSTYPLDHVSDKHHLLLLNDYQAANLLHALTKATTGCELPVSVLNSGDWTREVRWLLERDMPEVKPNPLWGDRE